MKGHELMWRLICAFVCFCTVYITLCMQCIFLNAFNDEPIYELLVDVSDVIRLSAIYNGGEEIFRMQFLSTLCDTALFNHDIFFLKKWK